jgi:hypothetical protein
MGKLSDGQSSHLSDLETASVPVGLDAGYRFSRQLYLGGSIEWGPGVSPNSQATCPANVSCFRHNAQLLVDARLYLEPDARGGWWLGFAAGWEFAAFSQTYRDATVTSTFTGPVFSSLQFGFDSRTGPTTIGPYLGLAVAEFVTEGVNPAATPASTWIPEPGVHAWLTLGLRVAYGPQ